MWYSYYPYDGLYIYINVHIYNIHVYKGHRCPYNPSKIFFFEIFYFTLGLFRNVIWRCLEIFLSFFYGLILFWSHVKVRGGYLQESSLTTDINSTFKGLPGGPVIKNLLSNAEGVGSIPGWGTRIPHAMWCSQKTFLKSCTFKGSQDHCNI